MKFILFQLSFRSLLLFLRDNMRYSCAADLFAVIDLYIISSVGSGYVGVD